MKLLLAPLAGFTDAPFRQLAYEGGADLTYTEMVSAAGLFHGSSPTRHLMERLPGEGPVACQLFGARAEELAFAARLASEGGFVELNLNAGCPMTKVTKCGAGAELVKDPAKVYALLRAMTESTALPVTLKTRLGPHPRATTVFELVDAAERSGAKAVILHARYTSEMHGGPLHLDTLAEAVARAHVPIIGNGSVRTAKDLAAMAATGVAAVMIGRAALADPFVFAALKGAGRPQLSPAEVCARHLEYLLRFREQLAAKYPLDHVPGADGYAAVKFHTHLFRYFGGQSGAAALRARLQSIRTLAEIREVIAGFGGARGL